MKWYLSQEQKAGHVSLPSFIFYRIRLLVVLSLAINMGLIALLTNELKDRADTGRLVRQVVLLGSMSQELSNLYGQQLETLSTAYALYGRALQSDTESEQLFQAYQAKLSEFNLRSNELIGVSERIKKHIENLEPSP